MLWVAGEEFGAVSFVDRLRARDEEAIQRVVHSYLPQLLRAARGAGFNAQNAEDTVQNTFLTFFEKIETFEGRSHVRTWLFGILYHKISETRRAAHRETGAEDIDVVVESRFKSNGMWAAPPRGSDSTAFDREIRLHLADCLEDLGDDQRLAFTLREVEELTSEEICKTMDISRTNLGVLLFRGRNKLRECLESRDIKG